jgi:hypothetical protein
LELLIDRGAIDVAIGSIATAVLELSFAVHPHLPLIPKVIHPTSSLFMFSRILKTPSTQTVRYIAQASKPTRSFHATAFTMVKVGDSIPNVELQEGNPGGKVNLADLLKSGKGIILGVPAAFSE